MNKAFVKFTAEDFSVDVKPAFDANDVADAFDMILKEKSAHSVNRLMRMFKLRNQNLFRKVKIALHSICQLKLQTKYYKFGIAYLSADDCVFSISGSKPVRQPATKEQEEEDDQIPGWIFACFAILGTTILTGYKLGMFATPPF